MRVFLCVSECVCLRVCWCVCVGVCVRLVVVGAGALCVGAADLCSPRASAIDATLRAAANLTHHLTHQGAHELTFQVKY